MGKCIKLVTLFAFIFLWVSQLHAFDLTQNLSNKSGNIQIDNSMTIDFQEGSFNTAVFSAKTINDIEWKYQGEDKWFKAFSLSFTSSGWVVKSTKPVKLGVIGLDSYSQPTLVKSVNGNISYIKWEDDLGTFVYDLGMDPSGNYKLVDSGSTGTVKSEASNPEQMSDTGSLLDELDESITSSWEVLNSSDTQTSLEDKRETGVTSLWILFVITLGLFGTFGLTFAYKKS